MLPPIRAVPEQRPAWDAAADPPVVLKQLRVCDLRKRQRGTRRSDGSPPELTASTGLQLGNCGLRDWAGVLDGCAVELG